MSAALIQGNFMGKASKVELGTNKKGQPEFKVDFEIVGGEHNGRHLPYSGIFTEKAVKYTRRAMLELGWQGKDAGTAVADITAAAKIVPIEVTVAQWDDPETGKRREWSAVRNVGTYSVPLEQLKSSELKDVNSWLAAADDSSTPF